MKKLPGRIRCFVFSGFPLRYIPPEWSSMFWMEEQSACTVWKKPLPTASSSATRSAWRSPWRLLRKGLPRAASRRPCSIPPVSTVSRMSSVLIWRPCCEQNRTYCSLRAMYPKLSIAFISTFFQQILLASKWEYYYRFSNPTGAGHLKR